MLLFSSYRRSAAHSYFMSLCKCVALEHGNETTSRCALFGSSPLAVSGRSGLDRFSSFRAEAETAAAGDFCWPVAAAEDSASQAIAPLAALQLPAAAGTGAAGGSCGAAALAELGPCTRRGDCSAGGGNARPPCSCACCSWLPLRTTFCPGANWWACSCAGGFSCRVVPSSWW